MLLRHRWLDEGSSSGASAAPAASGGSAPADPAAPATSPAQGARSARGGSAARTAQPPAQEPPAAGSAAPAAGGDGVGDGQAAAAAAQQAAAQTLFDVIGKHGVDLRGKYQSEEELAKGLANAVKLIGQRDELAAMGRRYQEHQREFEEYLASRGRPGAQQPPQGQQQQQQQQHPLFDVPTFDPMWQQFRETVDDGEGGEIVRWKADTPREVLDEAQKFANWRYRFETQWSRNPVQVMRDVAKQVAEEVAAQTSQSSLGEYQQYQTAMAIRQQNLPLLFAHDGQGNLSVDPISGQPMRTPFGEAYAAALQQVAQFVNDPVTADTMAKQMAYGMLHQSAPQQTAPLIDDPAQAAAPAAFAAPVRGGTHRPSHTGARGATGTGGQPQGHKHDPKLNLRENIRRAAAARG